MNPDILFSEKQRFKQWWLWLILAGVNGLFLSGIYKQLIAGQPFGSNPMSDTALLLTEGFVLLVTLLFISARLETQIRTQGIYIRFFPFQFSFRPFPWHTVSKAFVRRYNPIGEYGGWGIRFGFLGKGKAFNVSGNQGLQLEFNDGKKLLIGTEKSTELRQVLKDISQLKQ